VLPETRNPVHAVNPGYVLLLGAAAGVLSLVFPWVALAGQTPYLPIGVANIPSVRGWQFGGISILAVSIGIAVCGYLFIRGRAGLVTKFLVVAAVLLYGLVAIAETTIAMRHLGLNPGGGVSPPAEGSGPGIGMILCGVAVVALIVGAVLAIGWSPGYGRTPTVLWKQSHDS
jgi:hypothetical protein